MLPNLINQFIKLSDGYLQWEWNSDFFASWYFTKIHKNWNIENVKMQTVDFFKMDVLKPFWYDN